MSIEVWMKLMLNLHANVSLIYQDCLNIAIENPAIWLLTINQVVGETDDDDSN